MSDYVERLTEYLQSINYHVFQEKGWERTWNPIKKVLKASNHRYVVLYADRVKEFDPPYTIFHVVPDIESGQCMAKWEIYGKIRVVDLEDFSVLIEQTKECMCKKPHGWEHGFWKRHDEDTGACLDKPCKSSWCKDKIK